MFPPTVHRRRPLSAAGHFPPQNSHHIPRNEGPGFFRSRQRRQRSPTSGSYPAPQVPCSPSSYPNSCRTAERRIVSAAPLLPFSQCTRFRPSFGSASLPGLSFLLQARPLGRPALPLYDRFGYNPPEISHARTYNFPGTYSTASHSPLPGHFCRYQRSDPEYRSQWERQCPPGGSPRLLTPVHDSPSEVLPTPFCMLCSLLLPLPPLSLYSLPYRRDSGVQ